MDERQQDGAESGAREGRPARVPGGALTVRAALPADAAVLVRFNAAMARETEGRELDEARLRRGVERALHDPVRGRYLVAERDGAVVGALLLTREWSDWRDGWFVWIQSVYVAPPARRQGVYAALYRHVQGEAQRAADVCGLRLYVDGANVGAQHVYEALGMRRSAYVFYET